MMRGSGRGEGEGEGRGEGEGKGKGEGEGKGGGVAVFPPIPPLSARPLHARLVTSALVTYFGNSLAII